MSLSLPGRVFLCTLPTDMRKSFDKIMEERMARNAPVDTTA